MKKISFMAIIVVMPNIAFSETIARGGLYTEDSITPTNSDVGFFIETGVSLYSNDTVQIKIENTEIDKIKTSGFNTVGCFTLGVDIKGIQIGISPQYQDNDTITISSLQLVLDVPFTTGQIQPYLRIMGGFGSVEAYDETFDGFQYGIGGGIKYTFNEHLFGKLGLSYNITKVSEKIAGYDVNLDDSSFNITASLGYRF